jgi:hypothetical protein
MRAANYRDMFWVGCLIAALLYSASNCAGDSKYSGVKREAAGYGSAVLAIITWTIIFVDMQLPRK